MRPAARDGQDVMHLIHQSDAAFPQATFTERVLGSVADEKCGKVFIFYGLEIMRAQTCRKKLLVLANYQTEARELPLPEGERKVVLSNLPEVDFTESGVFLEGYQAVILEI